MILPYFDYITAGKLRNRCKIWFHRNNQNLGVWTLFYDVEYTDNGLRPKCWDLNDHLFTKQIYCFWVKELKTSVTIFPHKADKRSSPLRFKLCDANFAHRDAWSTFKQRFSHGKPSVKAANIWWWEIRFTSAEKRGFSEKCLAWYKFTV